MRHLTVLLLFIAIGAKAQETSVLFIGNSYTYVNDLPNTLRQLSLSLGETVTVASSAPGGFTFADHSTYAPTQEAIASQDWDYVVLQEQSQLPTFPDDQEMTTAYAQILSQQIEANYECTWPVFYMTWGRENGDAQNCVVNPPVCTFGGMQDLLRARYLQIALANDGYAAPVGVAWREVRNDHPTIDLYQDDGSHPTPEGTYLAACVFHSTLFRESTVGASFIGGLQPGTAAILQGIASSVVLDSVAVWNLDVPNGTDAGGWVITESSPTTTTYIHPGQGTHYWTCSNGQTFTTAEAAFVFAAPGFYTITHTYTDPCGNADTYSRTLEVYPIGIDEQLANALYRVRASDAGEIEIVGGTGAEMLALTDVQGRLLLSQRLGADRVRFNCPAGLNIWRIVTDDGTVRTGKVLVD